jgi:hypothetical protein
VYDQLKDTIEKGLHSGWGILKHFQHLHTLLVQSLLGTFFPYTPTHNTFAKGSQLATPWNKRFGFPGTHNPLLVKSFDF